jgi:hypothetical protein
MELAELLKLLNGVRADARAWSRCRGCRLFLILNRLEPLVLIGLSLLSLGVAPAREVGATAYRRRAKQRTTSQ